MKQKSRNAWLNLGYQNTVFFYQVISIRKAKNAIKCLPNDGEKVKDPEFLKQLAVNFHKREVHANIITLVPKVLTPAKMGEFRPIPAATSYKSASQKSFQIDQGYAWMI